MKSIRALPKITDTAFGTDYNVGSKTAPNSQSLVILGIMWVRDSLWVWVIGNNPMFLSLPVENRAEWMWLMIKQLCHT